MPLNSHNPNAKPAKKPLNALASLLEAEKMMQISVMLPSAAFIGWLAGAWLDSRLHQSWIAVFGIIFGGFSGLVYVVRLVIAAGKKTGGNPQNSADSEAGKGNTKLNP
jgi:hypothetical protein